MAFFSFLPHTVEHLFSLFSRLFIHPGLFDLLFKFPYIGNIFRMHIVQFFLEIIDLLLQGSFPVELLLVALLCFLSFGRNFCDLHKFIDCAVYESISLPDRIRSEDLIFFLRRKVQILGQGGRHIIHIFALQDISPRPQSPLVTLDKPEQCRAQLRKFRLLFVFSHIFHRRTQDKRNMDSVIVNRRIADLHAVSGAHLQYVFFADVFDFCGKSYRIERIGGGNAIRDFILQKQEQKIGAGFQLIGSVREEIFLKKISDVR